MRREGGVVFFSLWAWGERTEAAPVSGFAGKKGGRDRGFAIVGMGEKKKGPAFSPFLQLCPKKKGRKGEECMRPSIRHADTWGTTTRKVALHRECRGRYGWGKKEKKGVTGC